MRREWHRLPPSSEKIIGLYVHTDSLDFLWPAPCVILASSSPVGFPQYRLDCGFDRVAVDRTLVRTRSLISTGRCLLGAGSSVRSRPPAEWGAFCYVRGFVTRVTHHRKHWHGLPPLRYQPGFFLPVLDCHMAGITFDAHGAPLPGTELACGLVASAT